MARRVPVCMPYPTARDDKQCEHPLESRLLDVFPEAEEFLETVKKHDPDLDDVYVDIEPAPFVDSDGGGRAEDGPFWNLVRADRYAIDIGMGMSISLRRENSYLVGRRRWTPYEREGEGFEKEDTLPDFFRRLGVWYEEMIDGIGSCSAEMKFDAPYHVSGIKAHVRQIRRNSGISPWDLHG